MQEISYSYEGEPSLCAAASATAAAATNTTVATSTTTTTTGSEIMSYEPEEASQRSQLSQDLEDDCCCDENDSQIMLHHHNHHNHEHEEHIHGHASQQQAQEELGQSRVATSQLDSARRPPKKPRLTLRSGDNGDSENERGPFVPFAASASNGSAAEEAAGGAPRPSLLPVYLTAQQEDDDCSAAWSLRPLAPEENNDDNNANSESMSTGSHCNGGDAALPEALEFEQEGSITSHNSSNRCIAGSQDTDRWRTRQVSSFSSTLTERSRFSEEEESSIETEDQNQQPPLFTHSALSMSQQQPLPQQYSVPPQVQVEFHPDATNGDEGLVPEYVGGDPTYWSHNNTTQQQNSNSNNNSNMEQLTNRLDHWCSITNMNALQQRRNNIYAEEQHRSQNYNPQQDYDFSHLKLSKQIRKMQCKSAKQEVMRALQRERERNLGTPTTGNNSTGNTDNSFGNPRTNTTEVGNNPAASSHATGGGGDNMQDPHNHDNDAGSVAMRMED